MLVEEDIYRESPLGEFGELNEEERKFFGIDSSSAAAARIISPSEEDNDDLLSPVDLSTPPRPLPHFAGPKCEEMTAFLKCLFQSPERDGDWKPADPEARNYFKPTAGQIHEAGEFLTFLWRRPGARHASDCLMQAKKAMMTELNFANSPDDVSPPCVSFVHLRADNKPICLVSFSGQIHQYAPGSPTRACVANYIKQHELLMVEVRAAIDEFNSQSFSSSNAHYVLSEFSSDDFNQLIHMACQLLEKKQAYEKVNTNETYQPTTSDLASLNKDGQIKSCAERHFVSTLLKWLVEREPGDKRIIEVAGVVNIRFEFVPAPSDPKKIKKKGLIKLGTLHEGETSTRANERFYVKPIECCSVCKKIAPVIFKILNKARHYGSSLKAVTTPLRGAPAIRDLIGGARPIPFTLSPPASPRQSSAGKEGGRTPPRLAVFSKK